MALALERNIFFSFETKVKEVRMVYTWRRKKLLNGFPVLW